MPQGPCVKGGSSTPFINTQHSVCPTGFLLLLVGESSDPTLALSAQNPVTRVQPPRLPDKDLGWKFTKNVVDLQDTNEPRAKNTFRINVLLCVNERIEHGYSN